ncbi:MULTISPECIES: phage portal protein [unclassified Isoptericola]|uniref:phage portal protein n=1 Tax=unclassified Isoptericola TaxID=2623355 RepID=UPI0036509CF4
MGWLNAGVEKRAAGDEWIDTAGTAQTITTERATYLTPVFASIRTIVDYVSTLTPRFYRPDGAGGVVEIGTPELFRNIELEYGTENWLGQAMYATVTDGNAVGRIRSVSGYGGNLPLMIEWSRDWSPTNDEHGTRWWYLNGAQTPASQVAHIPWLVPEGRLLGMSPIQHYASIVAAGLSAQEYADVKRGGGIPPAVLKNQMQVLDGKAAEKVQSRAVTSFASGKPFVTGKDWDLTIVSVPPAQAQFIETLKLTASEIAAIYGLDPREVGGNAGDSLTYSNDESRARNRAHNMRPYIKRLELAVARWLPGGQFMRLDVAETIRPDIKTQTDIIGAKLKDGRLSLNEALALDDRPPIAGGDYRNVPRPDPAPATRQEDA